MKTIVLAAFRLIPHTFFSHVSFNGDRAGMKSPNVRCPTAMLLFSTLLLFGLVPHGAKGWSTLGHKTVAVLGFEMLSNNVRSKVTVILGPNDISHASVWPDLLRDPPANDTEMHDFIAAHRSHTDWHFINLPLNANVYEPAGPFARTNDIVQMINRCIDVLEEKSTMMSKRHALRWLVHLVGDLHQPLHVGCGYYRFNGNNEAILIKSPAEAIGHQHDRGGNRLHYSKSGKLHSFWDDALVDRIDSSPNEANLLPILRAKVKPGSFRTTGPIRSWSAKWAVDSVNEARGAYSGLQFGEADLQQDGDLDSIVILRPKNYAEKQETRAARQLAKGAFHLAELLNNIQWP